jgi:uncharacterized protein YybS (DUF2232 family)
MLLGVFAVFGEIVLGSALTVALYMLSIWVPVVGFITGALVPFPCIYFRLKSGRTVGLAIIALTLGVLFISGIPDLIFFFLQYVAISALLPEFLVRGKGAGSSVHYSVLIAVICLLLSALYYWHFFSVNFDKYVAGQIHSVINALGGIYQDSSFTRDEVEQLLNGLHQTEKVLVKIYPALLIICYYVMAGLNVLLLRKTCRSFESTIGISRFSAYRNPDLIVWVFIIAGFALMLDIGYVERIALIVIVITVFLYAIQGIAILVSYCERSNNARFMKILLAVTLIILPYLSLIVAGVGLFDMWVDFRSIKKLENL